LKPAVTPAKDLEGVLWKLESKTNVPIYINFEREDSIWEYKAPQLISQGVTKATATSAGISLTQKFSFNRATGKQISIENEPSKSYPGDGAFTLLNGIQNEKGLSRSSEFIGLEGKDLIAVIDLKKKQAINDIVLHAFEQRGSWIYPPSAVSFYASDDGKDYTFLEKKETASDKGEKGHLTIHSGLKTNARFVKIVAKNFGIIPSGMPGSGNPAWLFADEIEVN
jgi:hexosaminidase